MTPKRVGRHLEGGHVPDDERERRRRDEALRETFARWVSGVTIVAVRADGRVHALTVSAFMPVSLDPPLVLVSLGPNASARPYLEPGAELAISVLRADQRGLASRFADTLPVGPSPFQPDGPPVVSGAAAALVCRVEEQVAGGDHELVLARVETAVTGPDGPLLAYVRREYRDVD